MSRTVIILALLFALPSGTTPALATYDCTTIRAYVAQYGARAAIRWAKAQGYSVIEIALARAACFRK